MITIYGQPPSKSNCYKIICIGGHYSLGKTTAIKQYESDFYKQCPLREKNITKLFKLVADVYFKSDRPDLDNSQKVLLDCLQSCRAIKNDRQCMEIHIRKLIDKNNPRIEFELIEL